MSNEINMKPAQTRGAVAVPLEWDIAKCCSTKLAESQKNQPVLNAMFNADSIERNAFIDGMLLILSHYYGNYTKECIDEFIEQNYFYDYRGKSFSEIGYDTLEKIYKDFKEFIFSLEQM